MKYDDSLKIIDSLNGKKMKVNSDYEIKKIKGYFSQIEKINITEIDKYNETNESTQFVLFERPDLIVVLNEEIIGIEHFRVDASKSTRKGSKYKNKYTDSYFEKKQKSLLYTLKSEVESAYLSEQINTKLSYSYLLDNIIDNFINHYKKIDEYIYNIQETFNVRNKKIRIVFFIEMDIIFPSFIQDEGDKVIFITPLDDINFINFLKKWIKSIVLFCIMITY